MNNVYSAFANSELDEQLDGYSLPTDTPYQKSEALQLSEQFTKDKISALAAAKEAKVNELSGVPTGAVTRSSMIASEVQNAKMPYAKATLDIVKDADTMSIRGADRDYRLGGAKSMGTRGWIDSPEVFHPGMKPDTTRVSGQMQRFGLKSPEEVYQLGEQTKLEALYNLMGRPKDAQGKEWTPGPILYEPTKEGVIKLGSNKPGEQLGISVQAFNTGVKTYARDIGYLRDASGKINQSAELAKEGFLAQPDTYMSTGTAVNTKATNPQEAISSIKLALSGSESGGNYSAVSPKYKFLGKYQLGADVLQGLGYVKQGKVNNSDLSNPSVWTGKNGINSKNDFLTNKQAQELAMDQHLIGLFNNAKVGGRGQTLADKAGWVTAAHLLGPGGIRNLASKDSNGTSGNKYFNMGFKAVGGYTPEDTYTQRMRELEKMKIEEGQGFFNSLSRAPQAALAMGTKSVYDFADTLVELGGNVAARGAKALGASDKIVKFIDSADAGTEKQKTEVFNGLFGYDDSYNKATMEKAKGNLDKAFKSVNMFDPDTYGNIDGGQVWEAFKEGFSSPEAAAASLGYLAPYLFGGMAKVAAKTLSAEGRVAAQSMQAIAKSSALTAAEKTVKINAVKAGMTTADKAKMVLVNNADAIAYGANMTNDQLDTVIEKNGGEMPTLWKAGSAFALNTVLGKMDMKAATDIVSGKPVGTRLAEAFGAMGKGTATQVMAKAGEYGTKLVAAGFQELGQEFLQSYGEAFNKVYGTKVATDWDGGTREIGALEAAISPEVLSESRLGAVMGAAGGVHMALPGQMIEVAKDIRGIVRTAQGTQTARVDNAKDTQVPVKAPLDIKTTLDTLDAKIKAGGIITSNDAMDAQEILRRADTTPEDKARIEGVKTAYIAQLRAGIKSDEFTLKSKRDLMYKLDDLGDIDEETDTTLFAKAMKSGVVKDRAEYDKVKKDLATVEIEATTGKRGYVTQLRELDAALDSTEVDTDKVKAQLKQMNYFKESQKKYISNTNNALAAVTQEINDFNAKDRGALASTKMNKQFTYNKNGFKWTFNIANNDKQGSAQVDKTSIAGLKDAVLRTKANIKGIEEGLISVSDTLAKHGIDATYTGITTKPTIETGGKTWKKNLETAIEGSTHLVTVGDSERTREIKASNLGEKATKYTEDSVLFITAGRVKDVTEWKAFKKELRDPNSEIRKALDAARVAGATIKLDPAVKSVLKGSEAAKKGAKVTAQFPVEVKISKNKYMPHPSKREDVASVLQAAITGFGSKYVSEPGTKGGYSYTFKPEAVVNAAKEIKKAKEALVEEVRVKVEVDGYKKFRDATTKEEQEKVAKDLWEQDSAIQEQYKSTEIKQGWEKVLSKFGAVSKSNKEEIRKQQKVITKVRNKIAELGEPTEIDLIQKKNTAEIELDAIVTKMNTMHHVKDLAEVEEDNANAAKEVKNTANLLVEIKAIRDSVDMEEDTKNRAIEELLNGRDNEIEKILKNSITKGMKPRKASKDPNDTRTTPSDVGTIVKLSKKPSILGIAPVSQLFTPLEESGISSIGYIKEFKTSMQALFPLGENNKETSEKFKKLKLTQFELDAGSSSSMGLFYNKNRELNDTTILAGTLALDEYLQNNGNMLSEYKSKKDMAQMVGVMENQVGKNQERLLRDKGMFEKTIKNKIGKATLQKMGLVYEEFENGIEREAFDKLAADVGNRIVLAAIHQNILKRTTVTVKEYQDALIADNGDTTAMVRAELAEGTSSEAKIHFVKFTEEFTNRDEDENSLRKTRGEVYKEIHELLGDENTFRKEPSKTTIKHPRYEKEQVAKDKSGLKIPTTKKKDSKLSTPKEFLDKLVSMKWKLNVNLSNRLLEDIDRDVLKAHLGYVTTEELENMHLEAKESAIASNRDIEKSIEELEAFTVDGTLDVEMYFDWFYSRNGRYMMDSNTINPQTDKLHRFLIQPAAHEIKYTMGKGENKGKIISGEDSEGNPIPVDGLMELVNYALAQAFGYKVDKKNTKELQAAAELLKGIKNPKKLYDALFTKDKEGKVHKEFKIEDGKVILPTAKGYETNKGVKFEPEHISHTLQAIDMLEKLKKGGVFTSFLTAEYDAVTSGFGLKLLQIPIIENTWGWLNKVGIFKKTGEYAATKDSMNDILDTAGFYDSYQELAVGINITDGSINKENDEENDSIHEAVKKIKHIKVDEKSIKLAWRGTNGENGLRSIMPKVDMKDGNAVVTSALRSLFKDPFMTFNYSAGIVSIKRSLAGVLTNGLLDKIMAEDPSTNEIVKLMVSIVKDDGKNIKTPEQLRELLKTKRLDQIKTDKSTGWNLETYLHTIMDVTYGAEVERIMIKNFEPFMDTHAMVNDSFKVMFLAWKAEYDKAVKAVPHGKLTDKKVEDILEGLRNKFPMIKSPLSDVLEEGVAIYKNTSTTPTDEDARYLASQTSIDPTVAEKMFGKGEGTSSVKVRHMIREFTAAISSGSVVPIHYIDGALMAQMDGQDVTAIHDAIMPALHKSKEAIKTYNKSMYTISEQYSWIGEIAAMLGRLSSTELDNKDASVEVRVKNAEGELEVEKKTLKNAVEHMTKSINALYTEVDTKRKEIFAEIGAIGHMAGMPGSMWTVEGVVLKQEEAELNKGIMSKKEIADELIVGLEKLLAETRSAVIPQIIAKIKGCK